MKILLTLFISVIALTCKAQVEVTGIVKDNKDTAFYIYQAGGFDNLTRVWLDKRAKVRVNKDKTFKVTVPESSVGTWCIRTENGSQLFDLVKGENQQVSVDLSGPHPIRAIGKNAADFNFSAYLNSNTSNYLDSIFIGKLTSKNIDTAFFYRKKFASTKTDLLNRYRSKNKMSDTYYNWLMAKYSYEPYERVLVESINRDSLDDATLSKLMEKGINDEYAALNTVEYNDLVDFYIATILNRKSENLTKADRFNFVADGNILSGSTKDVYLSRFMAWIILSPDSVYNPLFKKYDQIVHNQEMKQLVISRRNDYQYPKTTSAINVNDSKAGSVTDIFKKYKGKVIYIDFWASWCVPCRAEMPAAEMLKAKLKGKDIVFVYLGYNDRENAWLNARKQMDIQGEHYLLTNKMISEANELFGINGIPYYAIIDKDGKIIRKRADHPSDVYNELLSLVNQ